MRRSILGFATAAMLACSGAEAASLEFTPVRVALAPGQTATTIELHNLGAAVAVQVRPYSWTQKGDSDELSPTGELVVSPPIFTIPEGESQVVRLLVRATGGDGERDFRLIFDELPHPGAGQQIIMALRTSVPVFTAPSGATAAHLEWTAERGTGAPLLAVRNTGGRSVLLKTVSAALPGGRSATLKPVGKDPNVLPGATRHWLLPAAGGVTPGSALTLHVTTNAGTREEIVTVPR